LECPEPPGTPGFYRRDCERFARAALGKNAGPALRALTATLYVLIGTETHTLLSDELGFTPPAYERWLRSQLEAVFQGASR
jgi:hypothetical protein